MPFNWTRVEPGLIGASYPVSDGALAELQREGVVLVINLHEQAHGAVRLEPFGMTELHIPVTDFSAPTPRQIAAAIDAIAEHAEKGGVAVHCAVGIGRTGTVLACWLVRCGMTAETAIARVRELRPGSVETPAQVAAVEEYARQFRQ